MHAAIKCQYKPQTQQDEKGDRGCEREWREEERRRKGYTLVVQRLILLIRVTDSALKAGEEKEEELVKEEEEGKRELEWTLQGGASKQLQQATCRVASIHRQCHLFVYIEQSLQVAFTHAHLHTKHSNQENTACSFQMT